jgi:hypothetical protein
VPATLPQLELGTLCPGRCRNGWERPRQSSTQNTCLKRVGLRNNGRSTSSVVRPTQPLLEPVEDQSQSVVELVGVGIVFAHNLLGEHLRQVRVSLGK